MSDSAGSPRRRNETYRHAIEARRVTEHGGGACTLLIRRINGHVELLFHCCPETGAVLTSEQAHALANALLEAHGDQAP